MCTSYYIKGEIRMVITAEELLEIVSEVEKIENYDERIAEITKILYKFYNENNGGLEVEKRK